MPSVRRRSPVLVAVGVLLVALGAGACNPGRPPAATVDGTDISAERVTDILSAYAETAPDDAREQIRGEGDASYSTQWASDVLRILVIRTILAEEARDRGLEVSQEDRKAGRDELEQSLASGSPEENLGKDLVDAIEADTRRWLIGLAGAAVALRRDEAEGADVSEAARQFYEANPDQFLAVCLRLILIAPDQLDAVAARLDAGEDFGDVSAEVTIDPELAAARGSTGECLALPQLQQQIEPALFESIATAAEGDVIGPETFDEMGNLGLIEVEGRQQQAFVDVQEQIAQQVPATGEAEVDALLERRLRRVEVRLDPRFGRWDSAEGVVIPPRGSRDGDGPGGPTTAPAPDVSTPSAGG